MIRAGRQAVSEKEFAELFGLTVAQLRRKGLIRKDSGCPKPINNKDRNRLFDRDQAVAYVAGVPAEDWPTMPEVDDDRDLLDDDEAAAFVGIDRSTWRNYKPGGVDELTVHPVPPPDATLGGQDHWYRVTLQRWKGQRPGKSTRGAGSRPRGDARPPGKRRQTASPAL